MNDERPPEPECKHLETVDDETVDDVRVDLSDAPTTVDAALSSSIPDASGPMTSAAVSGGDVRTQSWITLAALVVFAAAVVLLVVSIVQHG